MSGVIRSLPAFVALDGHTVIDGDRPGTSLQLDGTYFSGRLRALRTVDEGVETVSDSGRDRRIRRLRRSWEEYEDIGIEVDSLTERNLRDASSRFRRQLQRIPEVKHLRREFPGCCFVVPEWLRSGDRLHYGARVYFFPKVDSPTPEEIIQENVEAIADERFEPFERYQGRLHGYPDCCIAFYHERSPSAPSPEWRSIEPFTDRIDEDALGAGPSVSLDEVLTPFTEWKESCAFFTREFFPEPGCDTARTKGRAIHEALSSAASSRLVEDYFRLIFGYNYLVARAVQTGGTHRPAPGEIGREHLLFYLPFRELSTMPRYS